jgi:hypothetical protein
MKVNTADIQKVSQQSLLNTEHSPQSENMAPHSVKLCNKVTSSQMFVSNAQVTQYQGIVPMFIFWVVRCVWSLGR